MPRARFGKLSTASQETIVAAALNEFAIHGYTGSSLNRIITAAGISKGSLYYYFDDKADLYLHVVRSEMQTLVGDPAEFTTFDAVRPEAFWQAVESDCTRVLAALSTDPTRAALLRDALAGTGVAVMQEAQRDIEVATMPWIEQAVAAGQRVGAVRTDLPTPLLVAVAGAMGQAIDTWILSQDLDQAQQGELTPTLIDLLRRALEPLAMSNGDQ